MDEGSPVPALYPIQAVSARWSFGEHLDTVTSDDRPGQLALRTRFTSSPNPKSQAKTPPREVETEEWFDPAQDDRAVAFITYVKDASSRQVVAKSVKQFSTYDTFPLPDGRSYPTFWQETSYRQDAAGQLVGTLQSQTAFRFFPGRSMPEIPKRPDTAGSLP